MVVCFIHFVLSSYSSDSDESEPEGQAKDEGLLNNFPLLRRHHVSNDDGDE